MPSINIGHTKEQIDQAVKDLEGIKNGFVRAYSNALNKAATGTQTDMVAMARDDYTYKADAVRARTEVVKASWTKLSSLVRSRGKGVPLTDFLGTRQTSTGLTVMIRRSTGLKQIRHAFIKAGRHSGKMLAFWRAGIFDRLTPGTKAYVDLQEATYKGEIARSGLVWRYPIIALYGPHPELVYNTPENWQKLKGYASERMDVAFAHEIDYVLQQYGGT